MHLSVKTLEQVEPLTSTHEYDAFATSIFLHSITYMIICKVQLQGKYISRFLRGGQSGIRTCNLPDWTYHWAPCPMIIKHKAT